MTTCEHLEGCKEPAKFLVRFSSMIPEKELFSRRLCSKHTDSLGAVKEAEKVEWDEFDIYQYTNHLAHYTRYRYSNAQSCPHCKISLFVDNDYFCGGSHYWYLTCSQCKKSFTFSTYDFKLREWEEKPTYIPLVAAELEDYDKRERERRAK